MSCHNKLGLVLVLSTFGLGLSEDPRGWYLQIALHISKHFQWWTRKGKDKNMKKSESVNGEEAEGLPKLAENKSKRDSPKRQAAISSRRHAGRLPRRRGWRGTILCWRFSCLSTKLLWWWWPEEKMRRIHSAPFSLKDALSGEKKEESEVYHFHMVPEEFRRQVQTEILFSATYTKYPVWGFGKVLHYWKT